MLKQIIALWKYLINNSYYLLSAKLSCPTLGCEYKCQASLTGGSCFCPDGRKLGPDNRTCVDRDECAEWGFCDQLCINTDGSFKCSCAPGYVLQSSKSRCAAMNASVLELIFAHDKAVYRMNARGEDVRVIANSTGASGVDFHYQRNLLFWSDAKTKRVSIFYMKIFVYTVKHKSCSKTCTLNFVRVIC